MTIQNKLKRWFLRKNSQITDDEPKNQLEAFHKAMKLMLFTGQCVGLNPCARVLETEVSKMRFSVLTLKFYYCVMIGVAQGIGVMLSLYYVLFINSSIKELGRVTFYTLTCINTILFLHLGTKWPGLMRELAKFSLNESTDRSMKFKCYSTCTVILILAFVEHILFTIFKLNHVGECFTNYTYEEYSRRIYEWLPEIQPIVVFIQITDIISIINWNYSDIYITCISMYLVSILDHVNKKIILATEKHYLPFIHWRSLREDYSKATRLVRSFDDVISGVVFISFANNLFFICLQVSNMFKKRSWEQMNNTCSNYESGIFGGYEYTVYLVYSTVYLFVRSLIASLIAASVNSASLVPATALYNVPSSSFCPDVARLLNQVHGDTVALTGLKFFYITRELALSVAGTLVTYELVLLQVGDGEIHSENKS